MKWGDEKGLKKGKIPFRKRIKPCNAVEQAAKIAAQAVTVIEIRDRRDDSSQHVDSWRPQIKLALKDSKAFELLFNDPAEMRGCYYVSASSGRLYTREFNQIVLDNIDFDALELIVHPDDAGNFRERYLIKKRKHQERRMIGVGEDPIMMDARGWDSFNEVDGIKAAIKLQLLQGKIFPYIGHAMQPQKGDWKKKPKPLRWLESYDDRKKRFDDIANKSPDWDSERVAENVKELAIGKTHRFFDEFSARENPGGSYWIPLDKSLCRVTLNGTFSDGWIAPRKYLRSLSLYCFGFT